MLKDKNNAKGISLVFASFESHLVRFSLNLGRLIMRRQHMLSI